MNPKEKLKIEDCIAIILAILIVALIITQIVISCYRPLNALETSLFSILQFVFSLGFAWILAKISFRAEFVRSQKQFAIAAFRRIKEIDITIERVLNRIKFQMKNADPNTYKELDVILEIAKGTRQSIKSSIADWSDIIGEELATIDKIESLTDEEDAINDKIQDDSISNTHQSNKIYEKLEKKQKEVEKLLETLPPSLQVATKKQFNKVDKFEIQKELKKELKENTYLLLEGFWDNTFQKDIFDFNVGDKLTARYGDAANRIGAMIVYDKHENSIGVLTNSKSGLHYHDFFELLTRVIRKSIFEVEITEIMAEENNSGRHYFTVKFLLK